MIAGGAFTAGHFITMALSQLFNDTVFGRLLRGVSARDDLIVAMTGPKLGDRLLVVGLEDPHLLGLVGKPVGITGRACGIDASSEVARRAGERALRAGVLVEVEHAPFASFPFDAASFDVALVRPLGALAEDPNLLAALASVGGVLRDGGRCVVVADLPQGGVRSLLPAKAGPTPAHLLQLLAQSGFRGPRVIAERGGLAFVEAIHRG